MNSMNKLTAIVVCAFMVGGALFVLPAASERATAQGPITMTIGVTQSVDTLNPLAGYLSVSYQMYMLMYDMLVGVDRDLNPCPQLAESWSRSPDNLTWTYKIVRGATWHDGESITAHDVSFTYNLILNNPAAGALYIDYLRNVTEVRAIDDYTIRITTEVPKATMLSIIIPILPEHLWSKVPPKKLTTVDQFDTRYFPKGPVGSGPFKLVDYVVDDYVKFERYPNYYGGTVHFDVLIYKYYMNPTAMVTALKTGTIDATSGGVPPEAWNDLMKVPNVEGQTVNEISLTELGLNVCPPELRIKGGSTNLELRNLSVRQAIAMAINKTQIVQDVLRGQAIEGSTLIPPASVRWHYNITPEEEYKFNFNAANATLDAANYKDTDGDGIRENGTSGKPLSFRFNYIIENPEDQTAAYMIERWLRIIGIDAPAVGVREDTMIKYWIGMEYDMYIWGWGGDADPSFLLSVMTTDQIPTSRTDWSAWSDCYYSNPYYDSLFIKQQNTVDIYERQAIVHEMQRILYRDSPYVVLYYPYGLYAYRTDKFTNWPDMAAHPGMTTFSGWTGGAWLFYEIIPVGENTAPTGVSAGGHRVAAIGETQVFTGSAYDAQDPPENLNWTWTFEEPTGDTNLRYGRTVEYTFLNAGVVNVTLLVTDTGGLEGRSLPITVTVQEIPNAGWLRGYVKDIDDNPMVGALVSIGANTRTTDSSGGYSFTLSAGQYSVSAGATGYQTSAEQTVTIVEGKVTWLNFTLIKTSGTLAGHVYDADTGAGIEGVTVVARMGDFSKTDVTDATGYYIIDLLEVGTYTVTASKAGYVTNSTTAVIVAGETTTLDIDLRPSERGGGISALALAAIALAVIIIAVVAVLLMMKKKKAAAAPAPEAKPPEPPAPPPT